MINFIKKFFKIIFKIFLYGILIPFSILNWVIFLQIIFEPILMWFFSLFDYKFLLGMSFSFF